MGGACTYCVQVTKRNKNVYVQLKVQLHVHVFICILYSSLFIALHVSGAICIHPQEHKLQLTATGVCNQWNAEVIHSIKRRGVIYIYIYIYIYILHELVGMCVLIIQSYGFLA
jgi:hypothetical protein